MPALGKPDTPIRRHACINSATLFDMTWAEYFTRLTRGETQTQIGKRIGVDQTTVGRWLRNEKKPTDAGTVAHAAQTYGGNVLEAFVAAGFLTEEEAGIPPKPLLEFADLIDADPDLSPEAKVHIKNQYGLLVARQQLTAQCCCATRSCAIRTSTPRRRLSCWPRWTETARLQQRMSQHDSQSVMRVSTRTSSRRPRARRLGTRARAIATGTEAPGVGVSAYGPAT